MIDAKEISKTSVSGFVKSIAEKLQDYNVPEEVAKEVARSFYENNQQACADLTSRLKSHLDTKLSALLSNAHGAEGKLEWQPPDFGAEAAPTPERKPPMEDDRRPLTGLPGRTTAEPPGGTRPLDESEGANSDEGGFGGEGTIPSFEPEAQTGSDRGTAGPAAGSGEAGICKEVGTAAAPGSPSGVAASGASPEGPGGGDPALPLGDSPAAPSGPGKAVRTPEATLGANVVTQVILPNATVGKPYVTKVFLKSKHSTFVVNVEGLEKYGLKYDPETSSIRGTPTVPGDHELVVTYKISQVASGDARPSLTHGCRLTVNPDPKSLWRDLASDRDDPYWKEDVAARVIGGERVMLAASQRGRSHAHEGKFRDDHFEICLTDGEGWYITAIADGAGSAKYSRRGSTLACTTSMATFRALMTSERTQDLAGLLLDIGNSSENSGEGTKRKVRTLLYETIGQAVFAGYSAIREEAVKRDVSPRDYATTLILSVCKKFAAGWFVAAYWIGDGGIGVYRKGESVHLLGEPDGGEFAGQTRFLTMPENWTSAEEVFDRLRFILIDDFTAIVSMTDGITDPKFQTDNNLAKVECWDALWAELERIIQAGSDQEKLLLDWMGFWSAGNHDDRTLAIVY